MSHNLIVVSEDPLANIFEVICFRPKTKEVCPVRLNLHVFVVKFHMRTVFYQPPELAKKSSLI
jgi:hypothetical protein